MMYALKEIATAVREFPVASGIDHEMLANTWGGKVR
jgi:hypothetical protein